MIFLVEVVFLIVMVANLLLSKQAEPDSYVYILLVASKPTFLSRPSRHFAETTKAATRAT